MAFHTNLIITTGNEVPGQYISQFLGIVRGIDAAESRTVFWRQSVVSGNVADQCEDTQHGGDHVRRLVRGDLAESGELGRDVGVQDLHIREVGRRPWLNRLRTLSLFTAAAL